MNDPFASLHRFIIIFSMWVLGLRIVYLLMDILKDLDTIIEILKKQP